jgi:hypothetical protein
VFVLTADDPAVEADDASAEGPAEVTPTSARSSGSTAAATSTTEVIPGAPLLGERVGFQVAFVAESTRVLDLDSGVVRNLRGVQVLGVTDVGLVIASRRHFALWPAPYDGTGEILLAESGVVQAWVSDTGQQVWSVSQEEEFTSLQVVHHDVMERTASTFVPPPMSWPRGVVGDALVLQAPGGTYLMRGDGAVDRVSSGEVVVTSPFWLVVNVCDERLSCELQVLDPSGRPVSTHPVVSPQSIFGPFGPLLAVAPDGRLATLRPGTGDAVTIGIDGTDVTPALSLSAMSWSPDGRWLLALDGRELVAVDTSRPVGPARVPIQFTMGVPWYILTIPAPG